MSFIFNILSVCLFKQHLRGIFERCCCCADGLPQLPHYSLYSSRNYRITLSRENHAEPDEHQLSPSAAGVDRRVSSTKEKAHQDHSCTTPPCNPRRRTYPSRTFRTCLTSSSEVLAFLTPNADHSMRADCGIVVVSRTSKFFRALALSNRTSILSASDDGRPSFAALTHV